MAEIENLEEINENFDTIKTLLNSIRAQGILNTSDVDKLLTGINTKLEKINTDEDIALLKINLSELQKCLDERHASVLSKFGAIESLFSNLLKNSSEILKSSEVKELFDIVATNLSVFSREIVSQKESLTDISLRLETLRSDDSQKKEIIQNVISLKPEIERLSNGFDSIVININEGFKSLVNSISALDKTDMLDKFSGILSDIDMSSKTVLSAIQVLDKKSESFEETLENLYTKDDAIQTGKKLSEIAIQGRETSSVLSELNDRYGRIDILAEKIDASVNVIANLKSILTEIGDNTTNTLVERLSVLEKTVNEINNDTKFDDFKRSFDEIVMSTLELLGNLSKDNKEIKVVFEKFSEQISRIDVDLLKQFMVTVQENASADIKSYIESNLQKYNSSHEIAITKVMDDITSGTSLLESRLETVSSEISSICEKGLNSVLLDIDSIKASITQIDESNVSANNAIFANMSDRLTNFEDCLSVSLKNQEESVKYTAETVESHLDSLKKLAGVLDYKLDASVVESNSIKDLLNTVNKSVDSIIAQDFVEKVKDLRVDLYASKQDIVNVLELDTKGVQSAVIEEVNTKCETLINKLVELEASVKQSQVSSLAGVSTLLENISSSIVDLLSYVCEIKKADNTEVDKKLDVINESVKEVNITYIESVRDIVESTRRSIEIRIKNLEDAEAVNKDEIKQSIETSTESLRTDVKYAYSKLLEVQDLYNELSDQAEANKVISNEYFDKVLSSTEDIKNHYSEQIESVKSAIEEKMLQFKQEYKCDSADKINEIKVYTESINSKNYKDIFEKIELIKTLFAEVSEGDKEDRKVVFEKIQESFNSLTELMSNNGNLLREDLVSNIKVLYKGLESVKEVLLKVDENVDSDMTRQLSLIEDSFDVLTNRINETLKEANTTISENIKDKLSEVSGEVDALLDKKTTYYCEELSSTMKLLKDDIAEQTESLKESVLKGTTSLFKDTLESSVSVYLKGVSDEIIKLNEVINTNSAEFADSHENITAEFTNIAQKIETYHNNLVKTLHDSFEDKTKDLMTEGTFNEFDSQINERFDTLKSSIGLLNSNSDNISTVVDNILSTMQTDKELLESVKVAILQAVNTELKDVMDGIKDETKAIVSGLMEQFDILQQSREDDIASLKSKIEQIVKTTEDNKTEFQAYLNNQFSEIKEGNDFEGLKYSIDASLNILNDSVSALLKQDSFIEVFRTFEQTSTALVKNALDSTLTELRQLSETIFGLSENVNNNYNVSFEVKEEIEAAKDVLYKISDSFKIESANNGALIKSVTEDTKTEIQHLVQSINELESALDDKSANYVEVLNSFVEDVQNKIVLVQNKLFEFDSKFDSGAAAYRTLSEEFQTGMSATQDSISDISSKLDECIVDYKDYAKEFNGNITESIENLDTKIKESIADYKDYAKEFNGNITESIVNLDTKIDECIADYKESADEIQANITESFANINVKIDENIAAYNLSKEVQKSITDSLANIDLKLDDGISDYKTIVERAFSNTSKNVSLLQEKFESIEGFLQDYISNSDNEAVKFAVEDAHGDIRVIQDMLDKFEQSFNSHVEDIANITSVEPNDDIANLIAAVANIEVLLSDTLKKNEDLFSNLSQTADVDVSRIQDSVSEIADNLQKDIEDIETLLKESLNDTAGDIKQLSNFVENMDIELKNQINESQVAAENISQNIDSLHNAIDELKTQLFSKEQSNSEQVSIECKLDDIKSLIDEQLGYVQDINSMCSENLLDLPDMESRIGKKITESINSVSEKINNAESEAVDYEQVFKEFKSDIITQFLNIFNQISFVAEQEEILDFIDEKHENLIEVLSHIVTTTEDTENKIASIKEELSIINKKVTQILTSEEDEIDYVYSLQDLESDIANLRFVLNEMKNSSSSEELNELINSTGEIYKLVDAIKRDIPTKKDIESIAEDIVSISTRTNKLILASDESYKTLQDNLGEFKLVIDDLDERTRNFARESGMDKIDLKLNTLNEMMLSGAKTNQVFNQVFEYLAEWVDKAGIQINTISDKVETLDEIGQIKVMLADLKEKAEDDSESVELIEALGTVFDKQTKRIAAIESKIDKIIVQSTIDNKKAEKASKIDMSPMENTLNSFLVAIEEKFAKQEERVNSLEKKLEDIIVSFGNKDSDKVTKKLSGLDKQIAKLSKNIENIVSDVVKK